jgi:hypothetical protein
LSGHERVIFDMLKMGVDLPDSPIMGSLGCRQPVGVRGEDTDVAAEESYNRPMNSVWLREEQR